MKIKRRIFLFIFALMVIQIIFSGKSFAYTNHTADEAINWLKSLQGQKVGNGQCIELVKAYYSYLGVNPVLGNGTDYTWNSLPAGWQRIQNAKPQKGDILVYTTGYGHVSVYESDYATYHQNVNGHLYVEQIKNKYTSFSRPYWGVVRPDFKTVSIENFMFDSDLYYSLYWDLQVAFGNNTTLLKDHYFNFGIKEGRIASYVFDPKYYLGKYSDLSKAFTNTGYEAAFNHFIQFGLNEGRQANEIFDANYYLKSNSDLMNSFGMNYDKALEHFIIFGINEGRLASKEFNVVKYKQYYNDLQNAFGNSWKQYYMHYITWGKKENRKCI